MFPCKVVNISYYCYSWFQSATVAALRKELPCFKTPERGPACYDKDEVERILNYVPSPNPYKVQTPTEPLGLSENPTPGESKRLQKWLDRLPGKLPVPSPQPPPRRDSTASIIFGRGGIGERGLVIVRRLLF